MKEKRKTKNATASQKLNLASAHCRQKKPSYLDSYADNKNAKHSADTNTYEKTTGGNSTFAIMAGDVRK